MSALIAIAALAAQTATPPSSPATTDQPTGPRAGSSTYVDIEAGAGYSSNPFFALDNNTGRGYGRFSVRAVHTRVSDRTTTVLSGYAQNTTYTGRYGSEQSFDVNGRHEAAVTEQLHLFVDGDVSYDKGGQLDTQILGTPFIELVPGGTQPVLVLPGSDFLTVSGREYRASANLGGALALSPRDALNFSSGISHEVFKGGIVDTRYTTIPVSLGYDRKISPRTTLGVEISGQWTDYNGPQHFEVISPEATAHVQLAERLTLAGAVGVSFASINDGVSTRHTTGLTATATLCSIAQRGNLCGILAIDEAAATAAGPTKSASVEVDYSRWLDADQTVNFLLAADRYSSPTSFVAGQTFSNSTYVRAVADYSRKFGLRWFAGVNVSARKLTERGPDPDADLAATIFIRYRFGDIQ